MVEAQDSKKIYLKQRGNVTPHPFAYKSQFR